MNSTAPVTSKLCAVSGIGLRHNGDMRATVISARWGIECDMDRGLPADGYGHTPRDAMRNAICAVCLETMPEAIHEALITASLYNDQSIPDADCAGIGDSRHYRYAAHIEVSDWTLRYAR